MISLTLLIVVVALAIGLVVQSRRATPTAPPSGPHVAEAAGAELTPRLGTWVEAGLLTAQEASAIERFESAAQISAHEVALPATPAVTPAVPAADAQPAPLPGRRLRSARVPVVAEALGYLGAALTTTGLLLVIAHLWPDVAVAGRLGLSGVAAMLLAAAGLAVHEGVDPALTRLRAVLWLASTATAAVFAVVLADALGVDGAQGLAAWGATSVVVTSGIMWGWRQRPVQQAVALAALPVAVAMWVLLVGSPVTAGIAVWLTGALLFGLGLRLRTPLPWITEGVGSAALVVGSIMVASEWEGIGLLFVALTGAVMLTLALIPGPAPTLAGQLIAGTIGAMAIVQAGPPLVAWFAQDAGVLTGLAVWAVGVGVVVIGMSARTRLPAVLEALGAVVLLGGAAVCGAQAPGFAALFGVANAVALLAVGMLPGRVLLSAVGAVGLLVNVPWAIGWFFPGENRAPLLITVAGAIIIAASVLLTRLGPRFRREVGHSNPA